MKFNYYINLLIILLCSPLAYADVIKLKDTHPEQYIVVKGDTLWDISGTFLQHPWQWEEIWEINTQIENPHLIYPGDIIDLVYVDGKPQLRVRRGNAIAKWSPSARRQLLKVNIPTIPKNMIEPFLSQTIAVDKAQIDNAPYVINNPNDRLLNAMGDYIYARNIAANETHTNYRIYRPGKAYIDPDTRAILAYEYIHIGDAELQSHGDPATLQLTNTKMEVREHDRLQVIKSDDAFQSFIPHAPAADTRGKIISVLNAINQIGQYQIVTLNLGTQDAVEAGHVFAIDQVGATIKDTHTKAVSPSITLPDEKVGLLMVFRSFERVSYALVMEATKIIHLNDIVRAP